MRKFFLVASVLILLMIVGGYVYNNFFGNEYKASVSREGEYINKEYGFSFVYPSELYISEYINSQEADLGVGVFHKEDRQILGFNILVNPSIEYPKELTTIIPEDISVDGVNIKKYKFERMGFENEVFEGYIYTFQHEDNAFLVTAFDTQDRWVHNLISSLEFN